MHRSRFLILAIVTLALEGVGLAQGPPVEVPVDPFLAAPIEGHLFEIPVAVIRYFPTTDGVNLDSGETGFSANLAELESKVDRLEIQTKFMLEEGSRFRGYQNTSAPPSLGYRIVKIINVYEPLPKGFKHPSKDIFFPDYNDILPRFQAQDLVENQGVKEFWIWGYHNDVPGGMEPVESNMSSPTTGDISNSSRFNDDMPIYNTTYVVYTYNYQRSANEAVHNHGHQLEAMLSHANQLQDGNTQLFWDRFVGKQAGVHISGRAGWTHMPPNTATHYDYCNLAVVQSDIADWNPNGTGFKTPVSSDTWLNVDYPWPDGIYPGQPAECPKREAHWYIYWMQSMPGVFNSIPYQKSASTFFMTNWWRFTAEWDESVTAGLGLYAPSRDTGPTNRAPSSCPIRLGVAQGIATSFQLTGNDPNGDLLTYNVIRLPDHGALNAGPGLDVTYTSEASYVGLDSFLYVLSDGSLTSPSIEVLFNVVPAAELPSYALTMLPTLPGGTENCAFDINASGNSRDVDGNLQLAVFTPGGASAVSLGSFGNGFSLARAINDNNVVTGYSENADRKDEGFIALPDNTAAPTSWGLTSIGTIPVHNSSQGWDITLSNVVVGASKTFSPRGLIWSAGVLDEPFAVPYSALRGANDAGQIVGFIADGTPSRGFLWNDNGDMTPQPGELLDLGLLSPGSGHHSDAYAISENGYITGQAMNAAGRKVLFLLTPDGGQWFRDDDGNGANDLMQDLGNLDSLLAYGHDVNSGGIVVGKSGTCKNPFDTRAVAWINGFLYDLNSFIDPSLGWTLASAEGINEFGEIVGWGPGLDGKIRGFVMNPLTPSAPATVPTSLVTHRSVSLSWLDLSRNEAGFELEKKREPGDWLQLAKLPADVTDYIDANVEPARLYSYRIRAFNDHGVSGFRSWQSIHTLPNHAPTATDDAYEVDEDARLDIEPAGVLGNDHDPEGDPIRMVGLTETPGHGTLAWQPGGSFTYRPEADFFGEDHFVYEVSDDLGARATAVARIKVRPVADPPLTTADRYWVVQGVVLNVEAAGVLANDSDVDGDRLMSRVVSPPEHGVLELSPDGAFVYEPNGGFRGEDGYQYEAVDPSGLSRRSSVSLTVIPSSFTVRKDATIRGKSPNRNYGKHRHLEVDGHPERAALLAWDLREVPAGTRVEGAQIHYEVTERSKARYPMYPLRRYWSEGSVTWNERKDGAGWSEPGAKGHRDRDPHIIGRLSPGRRGGNRSRLNDAGVELVQEWVDRPASNRGVVIDAAGIDDGFKMLSGEHRDRFSQRSGRRRPQRHSARGRRPTLSLSLNLAEGRSHVYLDADTRVLREAAGESTLITIWREAGDISRPLQLELQLSGDATPGADYRRLPKTVEIPAWSTTIQLRLSVLRDADPECWENVRVGSVESADGEFRLGREKPLSITVVDDACPAAKGLRAYWRFDDGDGETAHDVSGHHQHGEVRGARWREDERTELEAPPEPSPDPSLDPRWVLDFDGKNDVVLAEPFVAPEGNHFSVTLWLRADRFQDHQTLLALYPQQKQARSDWSLGLQHRSADKARLLFNMRRDDGRSMVSAGDPQLSRLRARSWAHAVAVYDHGKLRLYLNGRLVGEKHMGARQNSVMTFLSIGGPDGARANKHGYQEYFNGRIDDLRIYDRVLSIEEIESLYSSGRP